MSIQRLPAGGVTSRMTDRELFSEYVVNGSSRAFAEIVERYSAMVYSTCLRILGNAHAAEDAAQAAFLILVRKAKKLPESTVLSGWLFLTAQHAALNERKRLARRARHERKAAVIRAKRKKAEGADWNEVRPELDVAIASLPARQRDAVVLYYLGGRSEEEVAREMGCARGTVAAHLSSAMGRLRARLGRRGVTLPATALAGLLGAHAIEAAPAALGQSIISVCAGQAAVSSSVAAIAKGTAKAMAWAKIKVATVVFSAAAVAAGGGAAVSRVLRAEEKLVDDPAIVAQIAAMGEESSLLLPAFRVIAPEERPADTSMRRIYGRGPGERHRCGRMAYAPKRQSALYCGSNHKRFHVNDVWEFHLGANTWRQLSPSGGGNHLTADWARAAARAGRSPERNMATFRDWYREHVVFKDGTLETRANGGPVDPIMTWDHLAYDSDRGRLYWVLGGAASFRRLKSYAEATGQDLAELRRRVKPGTNLWSFDLATRRWSRQTGPEPRPRTVGMAGTLRYVPELKKLVWYVAAQNVVPYEFGMWTYDPDTNRWADLAPNGGGKLWDLFKAGVIPGGGIQSAYSARHGKLVVVSGETTWVYDFAANEWWPASDDPLNNAGDIRTIFTYDSAADAFLLVQPEDGNVRAYDLESNQWRTLDIDGPPVPSGFSAGYYDPRLGVLVVHSKSDGVWVYRYKRSSH